MRYIIFLLIFLTGCRSSEAKILDKAVHKNLSAEIISLDGEYGSELKIRNRDREFSIDVSDIRPWKLDFCNVDGGEIELAIGVYKKDALRSKV